MKIRNVLTSSAIASFLAVPLSSYATTGAYMIGFGAKSRAMGGTGVAYTQDSLAAAYNPANLGDIKRTRLDIGADLFMPPRAVKHDSQLLPADERATTDLFLVPNLGFAQVIDDKLSWGFAMVGAGLQSEFDQTVPNAKAPNSPSYFFNFNGGATNEVGVELMQIKMLPSIAYKANKNHTFGATLAVATSLFRAEGLQSFVDLGFAKPGNEDSLTNNNWDISYGFGIQLGWKGYFMNNKLQLGANYSSEIDMSKFDQYSGLFPDEGDFDIPENYAIGIAYEYTTASHITFDIQQINYRGVKAFEHEGPLASDPAKFYPLCNDPNDANECKLGGSLGMGFGWTNQTVFKLGIDYMINDKWIIRGGWAYAEAPIPDDQILFALLAPATVEHHITGGATYNWNKDIELSFSVVYAPKETITGPTAFPPPPGVGVVEGSNAAITMEQLSLGAALGWKF